jgi:hypothetical protein
VSNVTFNIGLPQERDDFSEERVKCTAQLLNQCVRLAHGLCPASSCVIASDRLARGLVRFNVRDNWRQADKSAG